MYRGLLSLTLVSLVASLGVGLAAAGPLAAGDANSIYGRIVNDLDGDGDPSDSGEPGLSGWLIQIRSESDINKIFERRTDQNGEYRFDDLADGWYDMFVPCENQPALWIATNPRFTLRSAVLPQQQPQSFDFRVRVVDRMPEANGTIKGRLVWDENTNGRPDAAEQGIGGWTFDVQMENAPQCIWRPMYLTPATSADGSFTLSGLLPADYRISGVRPLTPGDIKYILDYPGVTREDEASPYFDFEGLVQVPEGGTGEIEIGLLNVSGSGSISGVTYWDQNENSLRDAGEPVVDSAGSIYLTMKTAVGFAPVESVAQLSAIHGSYNITGLAGGEYRVSYSAYPYTPGLGGWGADKEVTLPDNGSVAADFALYSEPGESLPTPSDSPEPAPTPAPQVVQAPSSGDGTTSTSDVASNPGVRAWVIAALVASLTGAVVLGWRVTDRQRRRASRRRRSCSCCRADQHSILRAPYYSLRMLWARLFSS
jgi:hypothetical protein